jgi:hypothetical protein
VRKQALDEKIGYRNDFGLTFLGRLDCWSEISVLEIFSDSAGV